VTTKPKTAERSDFANGIWVGLILGITVAWILSDIARSAGQALAILAAPPRVYHLTDADQQAIANQIADRLIPVRISK
jgi:hypothetical protein